LASTRRPRTAKKAVLVIDAIAAEPEALEPEVAPARPKRAPRKKQVAPEPPAPEPISAAHAALLAAIEASGDGGVVYERAQIASSPQAESPANDLKQELAPRPTERAEDEVAPPSTNRWKLALKGLDGLPPIRLPLGPAIPWRFGLPGLLGLVLVMLVLGRPAAHAESSSNGFKLPAESETYAVTQDSPLFTKSQQQVAQPIGVAEPAGLSVDVLDLSLKLIAVLALAYGSLVVLRRLGIGGAGSAGSHGPSTSTEGLRVLSTVALAPNRSIHVVRAPDGKTLLLGATPGQVNLLAELGDVPEVEAGGSGSFLDILTSKLQQH
jgi:flagellar biogenesis protein FliO